MKEEQWNDTHRKFPLVSIPDHDDTRFSAAALFTYNATKRERNLGRFHGRQ
jgi:hypothetical protein